MYIAIKHHITDSPKWDQCTQSLKTKMDGGSLPAGLKPILSIPGIKRKNAVCVWEAESIDTLKKFLDNVTDGVARNEYFEVDTKNAMGFPQATTAFKPAPAYTPAPNSALVPTTAAIH